MAVVGLLVALALGYAWSESPAEGFAIAGLLLQWGGLLVVALGFRSLRQRFRQRGWFRRFWEAIWLTPDVAFASIRSGSDSRSTARARTVTKSATPEQRLDALEADVEQLQVTLERTEAEFARTMREGVEREANQRQADIAAVRTLLRDALTDGIHIEGVGLVWLSFGVLFGTVPALLSRLLGLE